MVGIASRRPLWVRVFPWKGLGGVVDTLEHRSGLGQGRGGGLLLGTFVAYEYLVWDGSSQNKGFERQGN
jgi:hypothetical protein